ncbi:hypothetical protein K438DRAFT_1878239 [Mycena galopus ATCC 62051]|nr:hypothetical protein K438DRAFT_1878239 [Mycena galopus ATCC 62051]
MPRQGTSCLYAAGIADVMVPSVRPHVFPTQMLHGFHFSNSWRRVFGPGTCTSLPSGSALAVSGK